jgi:hypothetical protein
MSRFKNKKDFEEWAQDQFKKYGIQQPETYTTQELKDHNPGIPNSFIDKHTTNRDKVVE